VVGCRSMGGASPRPMRLVGRAGRRRAGGSPAPLQIGSPPRHWRRPQDKSLERSLPPAGTRRDRIRQKSVMKFPRSLPRV
jgi:hypothetical protein